MTAATLNIIHAGPQVSLQDAGRFGLLRYGVPSSGPMDRFAHAVANLALGNTAGATAIEVSLGGLTLHCAKGQISFAVAGGDFQILVNGIAIGDWCVSALNTGDTLTIRPGRWGSWCYLALAGELQTTPWLGSTATHGPTGLGGGKLVTGTSLQIAGAQLRPTRHTTLACPVSARPRRSIRVILGPQDRFFDDDIQQVFLTHTYTLSDAYDRMGVRLAGPPLPVNAPLDMPSEPIVRGSVQVSGDGVATVLLADHQTTGGYPKIATILSDDLDGFAQLRSRSEVSFEAITAKAAIAAARTRLAGRTAYLAQVGKTG